MRHQATWIVLRKDNPTWAKGYTTFDDAERAALEMTEATGELYIALPVDMNT